MANGNHEGNSNSVVPHSDESKVVVVMFPLPAQGHLHQFLNFSRVIASHDIPVYFISTSVHNRQVRNRASGWDPLAISNLHFHDLPVPTTFEGAIPDPNNPNKFPSHVYSLGTILASQRRNIITFIRDLARKSRRLVYIIDFSVCWLLNDVSFIHKTETYYFHTISAFNLHCLMRKFSERPILVHGEPIQDHQLVDKAFGTEESSEYFWEHLLSKKSNQGNIHYTSREIEGEYVKLLEEDKPSNADKIWAVAPLSIPERKINDPNNVCLEWLDKKRPKSVIFVSFGTSTCFTDEEVEEIAMGLERSGVNFLWVIRYADRADNYEGEIDRKVRLPEGFKERIEGRGLLIGDWAPQLEVLAHPSTGGFLSHCGWNSCLESISMGVPMAAWPMHSDQPLNAYLVVEILKIGVAVRAYALQQSTDIVKSEAVEEAVRKLMASPEGDEMRKKAADLSSAVKKSVQENGATVAERSSFIAHITR